MPTEPNISSSTYNNNNGNNKMNLFDLCAQQYFQNL